MFPTNYRTTEQYQKYVDEYMATLDLQISNDQNNFKQNELYTKTGQQIEELADTRSLDQKMIDITRLSTDVRAKVATLTDGANTNIIIEYLENNENYLRFVIQNWTNISSYMKSNYGIGVQAQIFIAYVKKLFTDKSSDLSGQTTPDYIFNQQAIQLTVDFLNQIIQMKSQLKSSTDKKNYDKVVKDLQERIKLMKELEQRSNEVFGMMMEDINVNEMDSANQNYEQQQMGMEDVNVAEVKKIQVNMDRFIEKWVNIVEDEMIPEIQNQSNGLNQNRVIAKYLQKVKSVTEVGKPIIKKLLQAVAMAGSKEKKKIRRNEGVEQQQMETEDMPAKEAPSVEDNFQEFLHLAQDELENSTNIDETARQLIKMVDDARDDGSITAREVYRYKKAIIDTVKEERDGRRSSVGSGLVRSTASKPRVKIDGRVTKPALYVPIGKYIINRNDLGKGVLKLRTAKGAVIAKFPTEAISRELCSILKCVSQNEAPNIDDINSLSTGDKNTLHKIVKESHINLPVPDLKLDKNETEYRRFLLLKGQVLAGQNNPSAIVELKRLIIKLTAAGRLPKAQSNATLQELAMIDL
jgi:hypothetical protein